MKHRISVCSRCGKRRLTWEETPKEWTCAPMTPALAASCVQARDGYERNHPRNNVGRR